jgi:hypothetical protein
MFPSALVGFRVKAQNAASPSAAQSRPNIPRMRADNPSAIRAPPLSDEAHLTNEQTANRKWQASPLTKTAPPDVSEMMESKMHSVMKTSAGQVGDESSQT